MTIQFFFFALLSGLVPALFTLIGAELDYHTTTLSSFQAGKTRQLDFVRFAFFDQSNASYLCCSIVPIQIPTLLWCIFGVSVWGLFEFVPWEQACLGSLWRVFEGF